MLDFIGELQEKKIEKELNKLFDFLENADYLRLKHNMLQLKWQALKNEDTVTYDFAETCWNALDEFEKFYAKGEEANV